MKKQWEALKPTERRWAVAIGVVVFLVINYFFIWPHFGDLGRDSARIQNADKQIRFYGEELRHKAEYERKLAALQSNGSSAASEDEAIDFINFYNSRAISNHVIVTTSGNLSTRTNDFFLEQQMGINVTADETNLVKFLYDISAGNSLMRVRAMSLHPDPNHMQLNANITLVTNRKLAQKVPPAAPGTPAKTTPVAAKTPTPAAAPAAKIPVVAANQTNKSFNPFARTPATNKPGSSNPKRP